MPAPTGVSVVIDGGAEATADLDVVLTIGATGADEMKFSNNGVDFSTFEAFSTSKNFNLSDFDGGFQEGLRTVHMIVRDTGDNAETRVLDTIVFSIPEPRIVYDTPPSQRMNTLLLDIPYIGLEDSPSTADGVAILEAEIDLTGAFVGSEVPLFEAVDDSLSDGRVGLTFTNAGAALTLVGDLDKTFGEVVSDITRVRLKPQFGTKVGQFAVSLAFAVNTCPKPAEVLTGRTTVPGREIILIAIFRNALGELTDPAPEPTITEITDPDGVDQLGGAAATERVSEGVWRFKFTPDLADPVGQWEYKFSGIVDGTTLTTQGAFIVADPPTLTSPLVDNACIIFGDLINIDGAPFANKPVLFTPTTIFGPERQNPTTISTQTCRVDTDSNGHFELELIRNANVIVRIPSFDYNRIGRVPDKEIAEYRELDSILAEGVRDKFGNLVAE